VGRKSSIDMLGLTERILKLAMDEKKTIQEIADILKNDGLRVSTSAIQRSLRTSREAASDFVKAIEETRVILDAVRANPNTDVIEVTTTLFASKVFAVVRDIEGLDFEDPAALANAISRLATAQTQVAKLRLNYQAGFEDAKKAVLDALKAQLKAHPDLLEQISALVGPLRGKES
jgi:hypothetical protein